MALADDREPVAPHAVGVTPPVVGREEECAAVDAFVDGVASGPRALVLRGPAGIGKTTLWETGLARARAAGMHVLSARVVEAERSLSFAGLMDLLDGVDDELARLPGPQRRALEVALLRRDPTGQPPEPRAIGAGLLRVLRDLAVRRPVIVAVDDVQWLDVASRDALAFAGRRLDLVRVGFLLTERTGAGTPLPAIAGMPLTRVEVGPLSFGATRHLLVERHGLRFRRHAMRRVFDATVGNPLFVLEIGRSLAEQGADDIEDDVALPAAVEELFGARFDSQSPPVRTVLAYVALDGDLRRPQLAAIADDGAVEDAVAAGLLVVEGDRCRLFHPLFALAVTNRCPPVERRRSHEALARVATDEARRARHLALAAVRADEELAGLLDVAATAAAARGARATAIELAGHALRLTPPGSPAEPERLLALADAHEQAGDFARVHALLGPVVDGLPAGPLRARGHLLLLGGAPSTESYDAHLEAAIAGSRDAPAVRARALAEKAVDIAVSKVRPAQAEPLALEALDVGPRSTEALAAAGWVRILRGRPIDDLLERAHAPDMPAAEIHSSMDRLAGIRAAFRGEVATARATFERLIEAADERGEEWSYSSIQLQLCEVALRAGDLPGAASYIEEYAKSDERGVGVVAHLSRVRGSLAVQRGLHAEAHRWADESWRLGRAWGQSTEHPGWDGLELHRVQGLASLLAGDYRDAVRHLRAVWEYAQREGIDDPGAFPVVPDLVEALIAIGDVPAAAAVAARLRELSEAQDHPWGSASDLRSTALLALARQPAEPTAVGMLDEAAAAYGALGLQADRARSLLLRGRAERRMRRWASARETLSAAADAYEAIDASGWAEQARAEHARISDRSARRANELTPSELAAARLAADGLSNREIARAVFVTEHTVEVHLSRAYAKLGIRSRAALARRLAAGD